MIGREYEQYLQSNAAAGNKNLDLSLWFVVTGITVVIPLVGFFLKG